MTRRQGWVGVFASIILLIGAIVVGITAMASFAQAGDYGGIVVVGGTFIVALVGAVLFLVHCVNRAEGARSHRQIKQARVPRHTPRFTAEARAEFDRLMAARDAA